MKSFKTCTALVLTNWEHDILDAQREAGDLACTCLAGDCAMAILNSISGDKHFHHFTEMISRVSQNRLDLPDRRLALAKDFKEFDSLFLETIEAYYQDYLLQETGDDKFYGFLYCDLISMISDTYDLLEKRGYTLSH